jgi:hypothetical protein
MPRGVLSHLDGVGAGSAGGLRNLIGNNDLKRGLLATDAIGGAIRPTEDVYHAR